MRTETRIREVPVPITDHWGESYKEAVARVQESSRENPTSQALCERIRSVAEQLHHGKKVDSRQPTPGTPSTTTIN